MADREAGSGRLVSVDCVSRQARLSDRDQFPAPRQVKRGGVNESTAWLISIQLFTSAGLVAHLVERCIRIAEVRGSSPLKSTEPRAVV